MMNVLEKQIAFPGRFFVVWRHGVLGFGFGGESHVIRGRFSPPR